MAEMAFELHAHMSTADAGALRTIVGTGQNTAQSMSVRDGVVTPLFSLDEDGAGTYDRSGDETVYSESAAGGVEPFSLAQSHSGLVKASDALAEVAAQVIGRRLGPPLGGDEGAPLVGLDLPDSAAAGVPFEVRVRGTEDVSAVRVRAFDTATSLQAAKPTRLTQVDGGVVGCITLSRPGLYRVEARRGAPSPVTQLIMVFPPDVLRVGS